MKNVSCLAVFCGSRSGNSSVYSAAARELGQGMCERGISLVFGGGGTGIMGELADTLLKTDGKVTGVMPHFLFEREVGHKGITELVKVDTMHVRKEIMYKRADGFVVLPGGLGTLEECFEVITWKQLRLHKKPIVLLNIDDCWKNLAALVKDVVRAGFAHDHIDDLFTIVNNVDDVFTVLDEAPDPNQLLLNGILKFKRFNMYLLALDKVETYCPHRIYDDWK